MFTTVKRRYKQSEPVLPQSGSLYFNSGSNQSHFLDATSNSIIIQSGSAFTIECFFKLEPERGGVILASKTPAAIPNFELVITRGIGTPVAVVSAKISGSFGRKTNNTNISSIDQNTWYHLAITRASGSENIGIYVDGISKSISGTGTGLNSSEINFVTYGAVVGVDYNGDGSFLSTQFGGKMTNLRIVTGSALYTASFTPPSEPLTAISGSKLLLLTKNDPNKYVDETGETTLVGNNNGPVYNTDSPFPFNVGPIPTPTPTPTPSSTPTPTPTPSSTPTPTPTPTASPTPAPPPPAPEPPTLYATVQMARQNPMNRASGFITTSPAWGTTIKTSFNNLGTAILPVGISANPTYFNYWKLGSNMSFVIPYTNKSNPTYVVVNNFDTSTKTIIAYFK